MTKKTDGLKIGVVFGGRSVEHKVSVVSARTVARALREAGYAVVPLGIAADGCWVEPALGQQALDGGRDALDAVGGRVDASWSHLLAARVDAVFPIVHGTWGEDGTLQGLCEMLDLPYVGAGVTASAVCMDKVLAKQVWQGRGIPVVDYEVVSRRDFETARGAALTRLRRLGLPLFVKPSVGGSSVGVTKVKRRGQVAAALAQALRFDDRVLVEKAVDARELECAVLGYPEIVASGVGEIVPGKDFYDYADKYLEDGAVLIDAADLPPAVAAEVQRRAIGAFEAVGGVGMARVDFLLDKTSGPSALGRSGGLYVNEINTLPGFTSISMYPKLWQQAGLSLAELVRRLVDAALRRHGNRRQLDLGIK
jgi:D-alanine-D-alanine ligase